MGKLLNLNKDHPKKGGEIKCCNRIKKTIWRLLERKKIRIELVLCLIIQL